MANDGGGGGEHLSGPVWQIMDTTSRADAGGLYCRVNCSTAESAGGWEQQAGGVFCLAGGRVPGSTSAPRKPPATSVSSVSLFQLTLVREHAILGCMLRKASKVDQVIHLPTPTSEVWM